MIEKFLLYIVVEVFQVAPVILFTVFIDEVVDPYDGLHAVQFTSAKTFFCKVDKLKGDVPFFEISPCLACFLALEGAKDLNSHYFTFK
jgi:hypothetical protein